MIDRPAALRRRILAFVKRATCEALADLDDNGRVTPKSTVKFKAVPFACIQADCRPATRDSQFSPRLRDALDELALRELIKPVPAKWAPNRFRWRRPDGLSVFQEVRTNRTHAIIKTFVGKIKQGRPTGRTSRTATPVNEDWYQLTAKGIEFLDRPPAERRPKPARAPQPAPAALPLDPAAPTDQLSFDSEAMTVTHGDKVCAFPPRTWVLFRLMKMLSDQRGRRVSFVTLSGPTGPWKDNDVEPSTVRGAVSRLRKLLRAAGLSAVADKIHTVSEYADVSVRLDK